MPFALVTIGLMMIVSGARDTYAAFGNELVEDFTGPGNFTYWVVAIGMLGALGYVPAFRGFSRAFLALVILSFIIANRGVFAQLTAALESGPVEPAAEPEKAATVSAPSQTGDPLALGFKSGDAAGNFGKAAEIAMKFFL